MIYYTVDLARQGFPIRFISAGRVGNFPGPFADPAEACAEFECRYQSGTCEYLDSEKFAEKSALPNLPPPTEETLAAIRAYVARVEAEDARDRAAGIPVFGDILDQIRDDESDFSAALGEGYLAFWDLRGSRPDMTAQALFKYLTEEPEYSLEWNIGFACGWFAALGESCPQANFFFNHDEQTPAPGGLETTGL